MTADQKKNLACFLDTAGYYLRSGFAAVKEDYNFTDDDAEELHVSAAANNGFSSLPLAYQIDEDGSASQNADACFDDSLEKIAAEIKACRACPLGSQRKNAVPGEGANSPLAMIIGEGPGADEDASGRPFVGKAGQLLDKMLASIGLYRDKNCFIANAVKCRPPGNRDPQSGETEACAAFLDRQIETLKPLVILCAGRTAARRILKTDESIGRQRGRFFDYMDIPVLVSYHPSALLRDDTYKRPAWEDLKMLRDKIASLNETYSGRPGDA